MEMGLKLSPKLSQQLVMTPQLKMAIKLLTLNHLELRDAVAQELVDNPVLEETYDEGDKPAGDSSSNADNDGAPEPVASSSEVKLEKKDQEQNTPEIDWEAYAESYSYLPPGAGGGGVMQDDLPGYDQTLTRAETLEEHLVWQIRMSDLNAIEVDIAIRLIGEMNDDGYLDKGPRLIPPERTEGADGEADAAPGGDDDEDLLMDGPDANGHTPQVSAEGAPAGEEALLQDGPAPQVVDALELVAEDLDVPVSWVENVRRRVMLFDPIGCLARDLRECLLVQLEAWGYDDECLVYNLVDQHFDDIEKRNFTQVAKACKVPMADIGDAMKIIEQLEPRPTRNFLPAGTTAGQEYITPDVYIHKLDEEYIISLNEDGLPKLKVSPFYLEKLQSAQRGDPSKSYIKEKMRSATWLIRSIHQRQRTIYKVVESILKYQRDWFDEAGPLRPLILKEVADDIEMHESTVSRVTTRKYLHCHRGIFELKYFFNSSIATQDGASIASESVKQVIKKIVADENPKKPLSDSAIVKLLKEHNIDIARRTVAKYREMLGILPSNKRKQVF